MFSEKDLRRLMIPLIIEQILAVTVGMADTVMVSGVGEAAVSGVSLVDMISVLIISLFTALGTGGAVVSAQYLGKKRSDRASAAAEQLLTVTLVFSLIIMAVMLILRNEIIPLIFGDTGKEVLDNSIKYLVYLAISYPFFAMYSSCAALLRAANNSRVTMYVSGGMNVINVIGNAVLIYGFNMGVEGAAIATLVSRVIGCVVILFVMHNPHSIISVEKPFTLKLDMQLIKMILKIGIPSGIENSIFQIGKLLVAGIFTAYGTAHIAANAVASNLATLGCVPGNAMGLALITVVGQCVGAGDYDQAVMYTKKIMKRIYIVAAAVNVLILLLLSPILRIYNLTPEAYRITELLCYIHNGAAIFVWPLAFSLPCALRASNDVKYTMTVSVFSMWMFRVAFSFVLGSMLGWGAPGVWTAMVIDWVFRAILFEIRFRSGKWKKHKILD